MTDRQARRQFLRSSGQTLAALAVAPHWLRGHSGLWADDGQRAGASGFAVSFNVAERGEPFSGRVYVILGSREAEPRLSINWFSPPPMLAKDMTDLPAGEAVTLSLDDPSTLRFPRDLQPGQFVGRTAQALMRFNPLDRRVGDGPGNGYSTPLAVSAAGRVVELQVDQLVPPEAIPESEWCRPFRASSPLLSRFHGRDVSVQGMVRFPTSYFEQRDRRYPVIYEIPGFGGDMRYGFRPEPVRESNREGVEFVRVMLDPGCPLGHHVFADSANNGPWGTALVQEFLPAIEAELRVIAEPRARLLTGHSSGGWSSLWLQVTYPELFGGVWSTAPDPVDFRDFQRINLYRAGENMYLDPQGARRPLARVGGQVRLWYDDFARMEEVLGPGGQLHSFEAVFSQRGEDGQPRRLWDRDSGAIDAEVAESWRSYDISEVLMREWRRLGPLLAGKLSVDMGDADTFYLEGATRRLGERLRELGSDAHVELHPGKDHGSLMTRALVERIRAEMVDMFLRG
ncbi:MAG: alpha/beta hydrolase-fold protein [Planctomycetaceae bacterium]